MGWKHISFLAIFIVSVSSLYCQQVKLYGTVLDSLKNPVPNILVRERKSGLFDYTNTSGAYELKFDTGSPINVEFSEFGFILKIFELDSLIKDTKINVTLKNNFGSLDEVIIQTKRPISVQKDTISFKVKFFTTGTEQTVEDLLKTIPGLQIDGEGNIKVGNQEIEKLMVDGDDLFERGYKILSKNMPAYPIEEVEVLKNYSNNRLLKGVEESDKIALNLKLDEKSKRIWFGNIETSLGNDSFYQFKGNLMNFGKKNKYYFLTNLNNIGYDATGDLESLIRPFRVNEPASIGDDQSSNSLLSLSPNQLNFKQNRTNFNNAELVSLNAIFNPSDQLKIKTLAFFNWDETDFFSSSIDSVNINTTNFINTENYELRNKKRIAFGKLDLIYNISKTKMVEATTKYNNGGINDGSHLNFNGNSTIEKLQQRNTLFDQKINYTDKLKDKKVFLLTGRFIDERTPQNYHLNQFFYQDLFSENVNADNVSQVIENQMQFVGINAHLLDRGPNDNLLELQLGNEYRKDQLSTTFSLLEDEIILEQPDGYQNRTSYQVNDLYFKTKYRFKIKNFGLVGKLDFHQLFNQFENNNPSNQNPFFINPSIGVDWKINNKNKVFYSYLYNNTNAKTLDVYSDFVLTGFRSFSKGTGNFNQLQASSIIFNYQLGNWSDRFFANTFILYSKNHDFFSTNTLIEQNYTQTEKIVIEDREFISVNSKFDYFFKSISSNLKLDLSYSNSEFKNIVNVSDLRTIISKNYKYGVEISSGFNGVFNYHIGTKWTTSQVTTTLPNSFTSNLSFLDLSFVFNNKFDVQIQSERYFFGNLQTDNSYYFLDLNARYQLIKDKLTLGLTGKNLFNTEKFRDFSISDIGSTTTEYRLLPRFALIKIEYRF